MKWYQWLWTLAPFIVGGLAFLIFKLTRRPDDANAALANAVEASAERRITARTVELAKLKGTFGADRAKAIGLEAAIAADKRVLEERYVAKGLTAEQVAERLRHLGRHR